MRLASGARAAGGAWGGRTWRAIVDEHRQEDARPPGLRHGPTKSRRSSRKGLSRPPRSHGLHKSNLEREGKPGKGRETGERTEEWSIAVELFVMMGAVSSCGTTSDGGQRQGNKQRCKHGSCCDAG